jgi:hypothetical protein
MMQVVFVGEDIGVKSRRHHLLAPVARESAAYVIFTSGSTGMILNYPDQLACTCALPSNVPSRHLQPLYRRAW